MNLNTTARIIAIVVALLALKAYGQHGPRQFRAPFVQVDDYDKADKAIAESTSTRERLRKLQDHRIEVLEHRLDAANSMYEAGVVLLEYVHDANADLLEAKLEIEQKPEARLAIMHERLEALVRLENTVRDRLQVGDAHIGSLTDARAARLQLEIDLMKEKAKQESAAPPAAIVPAKECRPQRTWRRWWGWNRPS